MRTENWAQVVGFEGLYEVSDFGRVRSVDRIDITGRKRRGKVLALIPQSSGYLNAHLSNGPLKKTWRVHRMVAMAFIDNPLGLPEVNHINEDKTDNRVENLEWCSKAYNLNHGGYQTRKAISQGKPVKALLDGKVIARFSSEGIAARLLGCSQSGISAVALNKMEFYHGLKWVFDEQGHDANGSV